jgi:hypothetical protein
MRLAVLLCLTVQLLPGAVVVRIEGNFGPASGASTVFDNQDYLVQFTIDDPTSPASSSDNPGTGFSRVDYTTSAVLSVPGIGLSVPLGMPNTIEYTQSLGNLPFDNWMNIFQFYGLPVGDFMLVTPLYTLSGAPLWNGLAQPGTPAINQFNHEPISALWRLQQIPGPGLPSLPIASYGSGVVTITVQDATVPEASSRVLVGVLCAAFILRLSRSKADEFPARHLND